MVKIWPVKIIAPYHTPHTPVASAAVRSKSVVLLLFIYSILLLPLCVGFLSCFVRHFLFCYAVLCILSSLLDRRES